MTTVVLQAAGTAIGSFFGGPIGGMVGRAAGALAGSVVDNALFNSGVRTVEGPRLSETSGLMASEGNAIPRVYGRARLGGQLIWATRFEEVMTTTTRPAGGGKGGGQRVRERSFSYFANLAVALCEGEISFIRRVWANGSEIDVRTLTMRVYRGDGLQQPDALILAKEGPDHAPAYRGTAYVVFERLPLADYGNRVPQFSFEVVRALPGVREQIRSVNLIPGAGEFAYATTPVTRRLGIGAAQAENSNQLQASTDVAASLDQLQALCPNLTAVSVVISWFGDDLRVGACTLAPRVDNALKVTEGGEWLVAGLRREAARVVSQTSGSPAYGGTPSDASVLALIAELKRRGLKVTLYPFVMMDIAPGNARPDPYGAVEQAAYPWRGRITCHPAPGQPATPDGTPGTLGAVASFVGTVAPADLSLSGQTVTCTKPGEWSFRRHILHYARLAEAADGVDGFIIGSELVGLTRVRSASGAYPFVTALQAIAADARAILGAQTRITYAADWTEYGAHVLAGGQEVRFPLDPLWASPAIDAVGIDYYPPISDWRAGIDHLDAATARSAHDLDYLAARQIAGEAFDWFYAGAGSRAAQVRSPITDGALGKPWIYRAKDIAGWWRNSHRERIGGAELAVSTDWSPGSKPIWLTEIGCPAVDNGANGPHVFPDPKSAEGARPAFSSGARDDLMQLRAIEAQIGVFDPASVRFSASANPTNAAGTLRMLSAADIAVWAWDARPFPAFPMLADVWSDGPNWQTGHWLNGRLEGAPLDRLMAAILADFGLPEAERLSIDHCIDGYVIDRPMSAREALEPLVRLFGLEARFSAGQLVVSERDARGLVSIDPGELVLNGDDRPFSLRRAQETELPRELRIGFLNADFDYAGAVSRSRRLAGAARREMALDGAVVCNRALADGLADQRLKEAWVGRETLTFTISPRRIALEPGDVISFPVDGAPRLFRIREVDDGATRRVTAISTERNPGFGPIMAQDVGRKAGLPAAAAAPFVLPVELPLAEGSEPVLLSLAAYASPWPGGLDILRAGDGQTFRFAGRVERPSLIGKLLTPLDPGPLWRWDRRASVDVEIEGGVLQSLTEASALGGGNTFAIRGSDGLWEVLAAAGATLIGPRRYRLTQLLRGLGGSEALAGRTVPPGAWLVGVDEALVPIAQGLGEVGRSLSWRVLPLGAEAAGPAETAFSAAAQGLALRPLHPVHPVARRSPAGVALGWVRRSRIAGDNWELSEPPLGEASESYELTIHAAGAPKRVLRSVTPSLIYPSALELSDFGASQSVLDIGLAQVSEAVGAGPMGRATIPVR